VHAVVGPALRRRWRKSQLSALLDIQQINHSHFLRSQKWRG
jgi:hypothetical protein